ncbi:MAG: glycine zipper domain-containing protein, partial [Alphaproteobacteria bacterium]|nr:glycine zipper domain-containing protein [Alphaproteobacteria bacterium]
ALSGGVLGAQIGSFILPGLGTAVGAAVGAATGFAFRALADYDERHLLDPINKHTDTGADINAQTMIRKNRIGNENALAGGGNLNVKISVDQDGKINRIHAVTDNQNVIPDISSGYAMVM